MQFFFEKYKFQYAKNLEEVFVFLGSRINGHQKIFLTTLNSHNKSRISIITKESQKEYCFNRNQIT